MPAVSDFESKPCITTVPLGLPWAFIIGRLGKPLRVMGIHQVTYLDTKHNKTNLGYISQIVGFV